MKKKLITGLLLLSMMASAIVGCGNKETTGIANDNDSHAAADENRDDTTGDEDDFTAEHLTFTMASGKDSELAHAEDSVFGQFCANSNISFEIDVLDDTGTQVPLLMSSGTYPDVLFGTNMWDPAEISSYAKQGCLLPLEDLIKEYAPNLTAVLDEYDLWDTLMIDGHIYDIPTVYLPSTNGNQYFYINERWLENVGMEMPTNPDELYAVLKAFKEQDANGNGDPDDEIPFSCNTSVKLSMIFPWFFDQFVLSNWIAFDENGDTYLCAYSETYKEFLEFWTKCYEEGLMEIDCFTQDEEAMIAAGQAEEIYGSYLGFSANDACPAECELDYTIVPSFTESGYPVATSLYRGCLVIGDTCENAERVISWVDQFYSEEGALACYLGIEGYDYEVVDGKYVALLDSEDGKALGLDNTPTKEVADYYLNGNDELSKKIFVTKNEMVENGWTVPTFVLNSEQNESVNTYIGDLWTYWNTYNAEIITGKKDLDDTWETYLADMKTMGAEEYVAIFQELWDAMK